MDDLPKIKLGFVLPEVDFTKGKGFQCTQFLQRLQYFM